MRKTPDFRERAKILAVLAPHLPDHLFDEALAAVRELSIYSRDRVNSMVALAPYLPARLLGEALAAVLEHHTDDQVTVLQHLAPRLPAPLFAQGAGPRSIDQIPGRAGQGFGPSGQERSRIADRRISSGCE